MSVTPESALQDVREEIDLIDQKILTLVSRRAETAMRVADIKSQHEGADPTIYRPEREAQVIRRLVELNSGPLSASQIDSIFREVMSSCRAQEKILSVAYLGPEGTYTHGAVHAHFGHAVEAKGCPDIGDIFREVMAGTCNYGVVPIENSTEGMISHTLDALKNSTLNICGEIELPIHHNFLLAPNARIERISRVYAHPQALAQCRGWLDANFPNIEKIGIGSNAEAAKRIRSEWNAAAIAGSAAAERYDLVTHAESIEDNPDNTTRFLVISPKAIGPSGDDKTSIVVTVHNKPGALYELLAQFTQANVDMTRIESRPSKSEKWNYVFFIDFKGHVEDPAISDMLNRIEALSKDLKCFGSYPSHLSSRSAK